MPYIFRMFENNMHVYFFFFFFTIKFNAVFVAKMIWQKCVVVHNTKARCNDVFHNKRYIISKTWVQIQNITTHFNRNKNNNNNKIMCLIRELRVWTKHERIRSGRSGQTDVWKRSKSKISCEYNNNNNKYNNLYSHLDNRKIPLIFQYFMNFLILYLIFKQMSCLSVALRCGYSL